MSNLRLLADVTGSSVSALDITDVFSSDFDIYKLEINTHQSASSQELGLRYINSSGSVITSSEYDIATHLLTSYQSFVEKSELNHDSFDFFGFNNTNVHMGSIHYIFNPFKSSCYTFGLQQTASFNNGNGGLNYKGINVLTELSSVTGIRLLGDSGNTLTQINARIYGLRVDT